ncbi:PREDICTED: uracil-DNA glycosylase, mitochondrial-like [Camelina sativa]|uniref:Uracil-DNA glycosylase n=1 Tax=Camelina sativa TaxID=90675 RepID=A0ABM0YWT5_CAMSA|nr:PREDICTED: uracil-DNA glycosylase, mitochondrial-like [Camelina sativa]
MASSTSKTLMDFFQPANKRLVGLGSEANSPPRLTVASSAADDSSGFTPEQVARAEFNKFVAKSKRNLAVCSEKVTKAKAEGRCYVPLSELLVEESWLKALPGELHKPYAKTLSDILEREINADGKSPPIYPPQHLVFNALNTTSFDRVKVVIIGQDPYHGPGQAMGLSFSVPEGEKLPSSLLNIFKELQKDVGCSIPRHGNLQKWAVQGVLLLNAVLTVRSKQPNSHAKKGWEQFTDAVIQSISQQKEGVVFLLWGRYAQEKSKLIDATKHHILTAAHPSGLSAHRGFFDCRHFSRANHIFEQMGIPPIDWQL